jgi:hypothetical protein
MSIHQRINRLEQQVAQDPFFRVGNCGYSAPTDFDAIERRLIEIGGPDAVERLERETRAMLERFASLARGVSE